MQSKQRPTRTRASGARRARVLAALLLAPLSAAVLGEAALAADSPSGLSGVVNINTASAEELQVLPGVGKARANAILALRKERGGFKSVDDLALVDGIGTPMVEKLRPHLAVQGATTAKRTGGASPAAAPREP